MSDNAIGSHIPNISNAVACGMKRNVDVAMTPRQQPQQQLTARIRSARWILVRSCHT